MELSNTRARARIALLCFISLCLLSVLALLPCTSHDEIPCSGTRSSRDDSESHTQGRVRGSSSPAATAQQRRRLVAPGSYPPRCSSKCGRCTPCRPVRMAVPPGTLVTAEYYPEAWQCKCGEHLYMP